ncbi:MAG TPA: Flp pilus assembly protein CpaB [Tepidisphaeraceae bacterium]|nr:Flp pilus assembly protein CpaB [Tepidisphaeraceae bacterium]
MNMKTVIPLVVAIVLAVVAAKLGKDMIAKGKTETGPSLKVAKVVVAKVDLAPGAVLQDADLTTGTVPAEGGPLGTFASPSDVVGRVVTAPLVKGQAVLDSLLAARGATGGAQAMIPKGMRAVTLEVNEVNGVAGLLAPGCRVDVVQTLRMKEQDADAMMAKTIVENLKIIAVGRRTTTTGPEPEQLARSVTVLATQEQTEVLDLASRMGQPRLVLRNTLDELKTGGKGVTVATLRGTAVDGDGPDAAAQSFLKMFGNPTTKPSAKGQPQAEVPVSVSPPAPEFRSVEVIRGGATSNVRFPVSSSTTGAPGIPMTSGSDKMDAVVPGSK